MSTQQIAERVTKILLSIKAITLNPTSPFIYASGMKSPIYIDNRVLISYPKEREEIIGFLADAIRQRKLNVDVIAGTATAGIPHAAWIAQVLVLPMIYVRSKPKDHGKGSMVEGVLKSGQEVIVIEDHISTGGSSIKTVQEVRSQGAKSSRIFAITTYSLKKADEEFQKNDISLTTLTDFQTIVKTALNEGYIKPEEEKIVLDWASDPSGWGKKQGFE